MRKFLISITLLASVFLTGCMTTLPKSGTTYSASEVRTEQEVRFGTVVSVQVVQIEGAGILGTAVGAIGGGLLGSALSDGKLATLAGAGLGGFLGNKFGSTTTAGEELTIKLETTGKLIVIAQERDQQAGFRRGDKVRILDNGKTSRVQLVEEGQLRSIR